jgi:membrane-associated protein
MEQLNPAHVLSTFGLAGVLVIVFIETALLVGFFLPGDSLLFTAGVLAAQSQPFIPLWLLLVTIPLAAIFGDQVGYQIGRAGGSAVFERPSAKRLGPDQLARARDFFERNGARTVLLARFAAVIRSITPVLAGASGMRYRQFTIYNVIGGLLWGLLVPVLGYLMGGIPVVRSHIELILIGVVTLSVSPLLINYLRSRRAVGIPAIDADADPS